ncbi:copper chaperone CopZ [Peribacillus psychrosaccharolyticus]|uniref:Copper chaperone CopZ n=1 Tax=Peribacillus psychrosaccharolyticus TaxID=1407 RepID=A0A974S0W3_PERPY|nr:copper chaperone CopZ [Peribacillus psychrosaccharolyticus]MEC2055797.1 copper chaperone CopZ [Peribacillus psychrosaccharolyticus]MED3742972.1 copper chaperone CopZ [Peribacillus psychrosaccharolyticus]QQT00969.1 copper chaperone CopZ [Peribacillus psychrosaccharolyticus]
MENVTLNVSGMSCGHCVKAVEENVGKLNGVNSVKVDLETSKVEVAFESEKLSLDTIKETIDDQGYEVK